MNIHIKVTFLGISLSVWILSFVGQVAYAQYILRGAARTSGSSDCYQLTSGLNQNGAVWYDTLINLAEPFKIEYTINLGSNARGADGIVMAMQTLGFPNPGRVGYGIGFDGLGQSFGVEFDTYQNTFLGDPVADHIALVRDGISNHQTNTQFAAPKPISATSANVKDGKDRYVTVSWDPKTNRFTVSVDCILLIDQSIDLINDVFKGRTQVYWGFTSSTGGASNIHTVCLLKDIVVRTNFSVCRNERVTLVSRISGDNRYQWSPAQGLDNPTSRTPTLTATNTQLYTVTYTDRCSVRHTDSVFVNVKNTGFSLGADRKVCEDQTVVLSPQFTSSATAVPKYRWSTGDTTRQLTPKTSGLYTLEVTAGGCSGRDSTQVTFVAPPKLDSLGETTYDCPRDQPLLLDPRATGTNLQYLWAFDGSTAPTFQATAAGQYTVKISADSACFVEKRFVVLDNCLPAALVFVPDAFTPNGDGINEVFSWQSNAIVEARMTIYNRWGEVVFFSENADEFWNGTCAGSPCPVNAYSWQLAYRARQNLTSQWYVKKGTVFLLR